MPRAGRRVSPKAPIPHPSRCSWQLQNAGPIDLILPRYVPNVGQSYPYRSIKRAPLQFLSPIVVIPRRKHRQQHHQESLIARQTCVRYALSASFLANNVIRSPADGLNWWPWLGVNSCRSHFLRVNQTFPHLRIGRRNPRVLGNTAISFLPADAISLSPAHSDPSPCSTGRGI